MRLKHSGVLLKQQRSHRFSDNGAAPNYTRGLTARIDAVMLQQQHDTVWGAGLETWESQKKTARILRMESIHIFGGVHPIENVFLAKTLRQGTLDQNSVDRGILIQPFG